MTLVLPPKGWPKVPWSVKEQEAAVLAEQARLSKLLALPEEETPRPKAEQEKS